MLPLKYASWGDPVQSYDQKSLPGIRLAGSRVFGPTENFTDRYKVSLAQYVDSMDRLAHSKDKFHKVGDYDPEFHYYRVISVHGDVPNDNGDMFQWGSPSDMESPELMRFDHGVGKYVYQTFIGRGNFKNHQNDDVSKAVGINLDVCANLQGKFIENLLAVDAHKDPELVRSIDKQYTNAVSMGARVAYSICSICAHVAYNEEMYCDHVKNNKGGQLYIDGESRKVFEDNRGVGFIELSWVTVPADPDALLLEKVAGHVKEDKEDAIATLLYTFGEAKTKILLNSLIKIL